MPSKNKPCPCGSRKNYKNCCMRKEEEPDEKVIQLPSVPEKVQEYFRNVFKEKTGRDQTDEDYADLTLLGLSKEEQLEYYIEGF